MKILQFLLRYRVGVIGGIIYAIFSFLIVHILALCTTADGLCILIVPSIFHQTILGMVSDSLVTAQYIFVVNLIIFISEGTFIECLVRKSAKQIV